MAEVPDVRSISDFSELNYEDKHILARKALVHQTDDVQVNVYDARSLSQSPGT
ncbi:MAG: hypothetical protein WBX25_06455 [Rhodomicrobium sp.]